jgi:hypothetical protein
VRPLYCRGGHQLINIVTPLSCKSKTAVVSHACALPVNTPPLLWPCHLLSPPFCALPLFPPLAHFVMCCCHVVVVVVVPPPSVCSPPLAGPHPCLCLCGPRCCGPCCLVLVVLMPLVPFPVVLLSLCLRRCRWLLVDCPASSFHPQSTPQAVAHEAGGGWCSSSSLSGSGPFVTVVVCSTCGPPCKQLLVAVGVGAGPSIIICCHCPCVIIVIVIVILLFLVPVVVLSVPLLLSSSCRCCLGCCCWCQCHAIPSTTHPMRSCSLGWGWVVCVMWWWCIVLLHHGVPSLKG